MIDDAVLFQIGDHLQQALRLGQRQAGRRLVHDDHPRVDRQRLGDLHELALRDGQVGHRRLGGEIGAEPPQQRQGFGPHAPVVDDAQRSHAARLAADEHVGGHVEVLEQVEFLVHEGDAGLGLPMRWSWPRERTPSTRISPALGATTPPRIFISVLLPAPFSPISPSTSAGVQMQRHVVQRNHAGIDFGDPRQLQPVLRHLLPLLRSAPLAGTIVSRRRYFASRVRIAAWNSATLDLSITLVGMMICLLAGMNAVSPCSTLSMSIIDW